jgi:hypothetical protein
MAKIGSYDGLKLRIVVDQVLKLVLLRTISQGSTYHILTNLNKHNKSSLSKLGLGLGFRVLIFFAKEVGRDKVSL